MSLMGKGLRHRDTILMEGCIYLHSGYPGKETLRRGAGNLLES